MANTQKDPLIKLGAQYYELVRAGGNSDTDDFLKKAGVNLESDQLEEFINIAAWALDLQEVACTPSNADPYTTLEI